MADILDMIEDAKSFSEEQEQSELEKTRLEEAKKVTETIKSASVAIFALIARAHELRADKLLGYSSWEDYVKTEFSMSASRSYQLLDMNKVVKEIESVAPTGTVVKLKEIEARELKNILPSITERIAEETKNLQPEEASGKIDEIVDQVREQHREEQEATEKRQDVFEQGREQGFSDGIEKATDALLNANPEPKNSSADDGDYEGPDGGVGLPTMTPQQSMANYNFLNGLACFTSLPDPQQVVDVVSEDKKDEVNNQLDATLKWLEEFKTLWAEKFE